eukprot:jgi/Botrbrau1/13982/Bobra.117_2s0012.1
MDGFPFRLVATDGPVAVQAVETEADGTIGKSGSTARFGNGVTASIGPAGAAPEGSFAAAAQRGSKRDSGSAVRPDVSPDKAVPSRGTDQDEPGSLMRLVEGSGPQRQQRLIAEAFAGDDVGSWRRAKANRKDAKLKGVIIKEKWDKKFTEKFSTPSVPFPFDSRETYERSMRQPLGRDYNTDAVFRDLTRPAVLKVTGSIIQPLRYSEKSAAVAVQQHLGKVPTRKKTALVAAGIPRPSRR